MSRYIFLFFSILLLTSCKTQYAYFQESSTPSVQAKVKKKDFLKVEEMSSKSIKPMIISMAEKKIEVNSRNFSLPIIIEPEKVERLEHRENSTFEKPSADFFNPKVKEKPKPKKKKKGKKFRQISSNLFVGFVFLGIAIVVAFLKLPTLVMLFGLASIIFLAIGLKKIWKKKRRQSRFKNIFKNEK